MVLTSKDGNVIFYTKSRILDIFCTCNITINIVFKGFSVKEYWCIDVIILLYIEVTLMKIIIRTTGSIFLILFIFTSLCGCQNTDTDQTISSRSEEHTSELQSLAYLVCRLLLEKKNNGWNAANKIIGR